MKNLVSIIVPVYNTEKYLSKCLDSLIKQTYKNLEIILIDDSSTDNSIAICKDYQKKDERIKIYQKENGGPASARNYGLEKARGEYILFIDSDDYIDIKAVSLLIDNYSEDTLVGLREKINNQEVFQTKKLEYSALEFLKLNLLGKTPGRGGCCGHLFKKSRIQNMRFDETLYLAEDIVFLFEYTLKMNKVKYIKEPVYYYYVINNNSLTRSSDNFIRKITSVYNVFKQIDIITNKMLSKEIGNHQVIMLEKEMRYIKTYEDMEEVLKNIDKIKYQGLNIRYLFFSYLLNKKKIKLLLSYFNLRRKIKKKIKKMD